MNPIKAWNRFWFGPISARPLGVFRVVMGLIALANLGFLAFDLDYWFTDVGLLQGDEARVIAGPLRPSPLQWIQDPTSVRLFFAGTSVVTALFTLGWHTRVMGVLLYLAMLSIHNRNVVTNCGPDALLLIMLFYLMLSPCGAAYSLDALRTARRRGTAAEPLILPWAQRLVQLQLCLIYFDTAVLKCNGSTWLGGTALHFVVTNSEVGRIQFAWLSDYPLLINVLTHSALFVEFSLAFLLWSRATRRWAILAGLALHLGVMLTVNVPIFGEVMTACYLVFLAPDELDALVRTLDPRRWTRRPASRRAPLSFPGRVDPGGVPSGPHPLEAARPTVEAPTAQGR